MDPVSTKIYSNEPYERREIIIWKSQSIVCPTKIDVLYIGPDPEKEIAPIFYRDWRVDEYYGDHVYVNHSIVERKREEIILQECGKFDHKYGEYIIHPVRVKDHKVLGNIPPQMIFQTLEESIEKMFRELRIKK